MSEKDHDFGSLVCVYAQLLPKIREAGKAMGYAIAIHGSMQRDLDLLAVPWVEGARPAEELVAFIAEAVRGYVIGNVDERGGIDAPTIQPHGRRSWNICWGGRPFIDLSVMPCAAAPPSGVDREEIAGLQKRLCEDRCMPCPDGILATLTTRIATFCGAYSAPSRGAKP